MDKHMEDDVTSIMRLSLRNALDGKECWELTLDFFERDPNRRARSELIESRHQSLARGDGWDLGRTVAENYKQKYEPDKFYTYTPEELDRLEELRELNEATKPQPQVMSDPPMTEDKLAELHKMLDEIEGKHE